MIKTPNTATPTATRIVMPACLQWESSVVGALVRARAAVGASIAVVGAYASAPAFTKDAPGVRAWSPPV